MLIAALMSLDVFEAQWFEYYGALKGFISEFDRLPKRNESFNSLRIGPWLANQKHMYKQGNLSEERIRLLTGVGVDLFLDVFETQWLENFNALKGFVAEFGRAPKAAESFNMFAIGVWLRTQKHMYKQGMLSDERVRLLTEAGLDLSLDIFETQWQKHYDGLKDFIAEFGRLPKYNESFNGLRIGKWLSRQKHKYKQGELSEERLHLLTEAGVDPSLDIFETQWFRHYSVLKRFIAEFSRLPKQRESFNGLRIGVWLNAQKKMYKQGKLSNERIRLLTEVGIYLSLDVVETQWHKNYNALKGFMSEFGRLPKQKESFNGIHVGKWLYYRKKSYIKGKLPEKCVQLLTEAGVDLSLDIFETQWQKHYDGLKDFIAEFDRLPKQRESFNGLRIGWWLANQKQIYKQGKLSEERIRMLEEAGVSFLEKINPRSICTVGNAKLH